MSWYQWLNAYLPSIGLMLTMFGMGLSLTVGDFARVARAPRAVAVGLAAQILGLPLVAAAMILVLKPDPLLAMVLVALSASPGGASSNALTLLAKGDLPLGVTLTAINSLIAFATTPFIVTYGAELFGTEAAQMTLEPGKIVLLLLLQVVAPILVGLVLARYLKRFANPIVYVGLVCIVVPTIALGFQTVSAGMGRLLWISVVLCGLFNLLCTGVGYAAAAAARLDQPARRTMMIETGIHNFGLFVVIAGQVFHSPEMIRAGAPYLFWMLGTAVTVAAVQAINRRKMENRG